MEIAARIRRVKTLLYVLQQQQTQSWENPTYMTNIIYKEMKRSLHQISEGVYFHLLNAKP